MEHQYLKIVSLFDNIYDPKPSEVEIKDVLESIRGGLYKNIIEKCRYAIRENDYYLYNSFKVTIPAVTFSGEFLGKRKKENLKSYSQFIVLDFDKLERINEFEKIVSNDPYIFAAWLSPSGTGYKVLIKVRNSLEQHLYAFDALVDYFDDTYRYQVDVSGSDVTRLCILSYDPNIYINENSKEWTEIKKRNEEKIDFTKLTPSKNNSIVTSHKEKLLMRKILRFLKYRNLSITENYERWYKVSLILSATFGYKEGLKIFLQLCRLDGIRHSEERSIYIYEYSFRNNSRKISFPTIIFYAKEKGFKL